MVTLNALRDNSGSKRFRMRVGRGIGSGKGKTSGSGGKGQTARSGVSLNGFEGGQMPLYRRLPKRGFRNIFAKCYAVVNLFTLQSAIDRGVLDPRGIISIETLIAAGVVRRRCDGLHVLGQGSLQSSLHVQALRFSKGAALRLQEAGGTVEVVSGSVPGGNG